MFDLHAHQSTSIDMLRASLKSGKRRPMLQLATGSGKTVVAAAITQMAREKDNRVLFIVDSIQLIDQTVNRFYSAGLEGIGVIQARHQMEDWSKPIQVASVQTLCRRGFPKFDLAIVDEAHSMNQWLLKQMADQQYARVPFIGLSATPWAKGLGAHYDDLLTPITMRELIDQGFIAPFRVFAAAHPDLSAVKVKRGDYDQEQLSQVMAKGELIADIVTTWKDLGENRPTIAFCVNRNHAQEVQAQFTAAGVGCGYIDGETEVADRKIIERRLNSGDLKVVTSVGCLVKGVDWAIGCIIDAAPTKSEMLHVQKIGRGLRVNPEIGPDCLVLDHASNMLKLGFPTDIQHTRLPGGTHAVGQSVERPAPLPKECAKCSYLRPIGVYVCPACGHEARPPVREVTQHGGSLVPLAKGAKIKVKVKVEPADKRRFYAELKGYVMATGKAEGYAAHLFRARFGSWPHSKNSIQPIPPSSETLSYIKSRNIAFARGPRR